MAQPITFSAEIQQHQDMNAGYVFFPFDTVEVFGKKGKSKSKQFLITMQNIVAALPI